MNTVISTLPTSCPFGQIIVGSTCTATSGSIFNDIFALPATLLNIPQGSTGLEPLIVSIAVWGGLLLLIVTAK